MWQLQEPEEKNVTFYVKKNKKQFWLILVHVRYLHMSPVSPQKKDRKATKPTVTK